MMKYQVQNLIGNYCVTAPDGQTLYDLIHPVLLRQEGVTLDFMGIKAYGAPFFNSAIGQLLKDIPYEDVTTLVKYLNLSNCSQNVLGVVLSSSKRYYKDPSYRRAVNKIIIFNE